MKNIRIFLSENLQFLEVKFSICLNRRLFVMCLCCIVLYEYLVWQYWGIRYNVYRMRVS